MNISFTKQQEGYIAKQIESGDYQNAAEVVREALRYHQLYRTKIANELKEAINQGWEGPASNRSVQDIIAAKKKAKKNGRDSIL
ncbi:type II toxin-antitoxin system ParD family antitoxin [Tunicatimonas pelagia]|uniref:type II toxin-antitoxin system ParD family antitoxin n=1 Tax=Tunicatimonas pelagia TaxID=931531 RepID=UPI0026670DE9|nr:type II toxin-antitoxin system ParD family antitoxin [Tunicatimonas pelagia]WKN44323.1 type II toxin-antitoxin system ParD family antitoxin [Tunicatimonas pelagia]